MKFIRTLLLVPVIVSALVISGCATSPSNGNQAPMAPTLAQEKAALSNAKPVSQEVPRLKILMACGSCDVPDTVPGLISQGYADAAAKSGMQVSADMEATLSITDYSQRPPGARVMFGAFAGKDEIKAVVTYKDKKFEVEDYYRNAWLGMNSLSQRIGEMVFEKMK